MCEQIVRLNVKPPEYVTKLVAVNDKGRICSMCVPTPIHKGRWNKAPKRFSRKLPKGFGPRHGTFEGDHLPSRLGHQHHRGMWSVCRTEGTQGFWRIPNLYALRNSTNQRRAVALFKVRGKCHKCMGWMGDTYLVEEIKFVKFLKGGPDNV